MNKKYRVAVSYVIETEGTNDQQAITNALFTSPCNETARHVALKVVNCYVPKALALKDGEIVALPAEQES